MKISIVMATYNGIKYIEAQLQSIRNQIRKPDEVIICDDCSKDGTFNYILDYIEQYHLLSWKVILNSANLGFSKNFQKAMALCSGDIVCFCDQDDVWLPYKLQVVENFFIEHTNYLCLISAVRCIDEKNCLIKHNIKMCRAGVLDSLKSENVDFKKLFQKMILQGPYLGMSMAVSSVVIRALSGFVSLESHDWLAAVWSSLYGQIFYMGEVLQLHRFHGNNVSLLASKKAKRYSEKRILLCDEHIRHANMIRAYLQEDQEKYAKELVYVSAFIQLTKDRKVWLEGKSCFAPFIWRYFRIYASIKVYLKDVYAYCVRC